MKIILFILRVLLVIAIISLISSFVLFIFEYTKLEIPSFLEFALGFTGFIYLIFDWFLGLGLNIFPPTQCTTYLCTESVGNQMIFYGITTLILFSIYQILVHWRNWFKHQNTLQ